MKDYLDVQVDRPWGGTCEEGCADRLSNVSTEKEVRYEIVLLLLYLSVHVCSCFGKQSTFMKKDNLTNILS